MTALHFPFPVLYNQVTVFRHGLPRPGLLWDDANVQQGFAWDEETVAFGVGDTDNNCLLDVDVADHVSISPHAISALAVPFAVKAPRLDVGTVGYAQQFALPVGSYTLVFETLPALVQDDEPFDHLFRMRFVADPHPQFAILKRGGEVRADHVLNRQAKRA